jgi:predicted oxidoreductase
MESRPVINVEEFIGKTLQLDPSIRSKLEIVTKSGIYIPCEFHPDRKTAFYNATAERIVKSAEKSLRFLGTDYIDLLLVHRPDWLTSIDETAAGLNKLLKDGKIRSAGVSNYNVHQFDALNSRMDQPLVTNQIEFHLLHTDPIHDGSLDQAQKLRFKPMAWSPLATPRSTRTSSGSGNGQAESRHKAMGPMASLPLPLPPLPPPADAEKLARRRSSAAHIASNTVPRSYMGNRKCTFF